MPVASLTSEKEISRPHSFSFSFHNSNKYARNAIIPPLRKVSLPICKNRLTFEQKYDSIGDAKPLSQKTQYAIIHFCKDSSPDGLMVWRPSRCQGYFVFTNRRGSERVPTVTLPLDTRKDRFPMSSPNITTVLSSDNWQALILEMYPGCCLDFWAKRRSRILSGVQSNSFGKQPKDNKQQKSSPDSILWTRTEETTVLPAPKLFVSIDSAAGFTAVMDTSGVVRYEESV